MSKSQFECEAAEFEKQCGPAFIDKCVAEVASVKRLTPDGF
jgi:hypothetical protein